MMGNSFINFLLHTPLRRWLADTMIITVTGRKTGRHYSLPVGFFEENGWLWVMSARERTWWRNVRGGADVDLYLRGQTHHGHAEVVLEEPAVQERLGVYLQAVPMAVRPLGAHFIDGELDPEDARRLTSERMFVKIQLSAN